MQLSHTLRRVSASFDDPNLVSVAGLVPIMNLARNAGLATLADEWLSVPTDKGTNAGLKVASLVAGMVAGADSIDDMAILRHGGMGKLFPALYAPSTLGSFLRAFSFGHVRQLDAVASRFLRALAGRASLLVKPNTDGYALVDIDDTIVPVHGYQKQGAGFGYSKVRGLNALLATVTTAGAPVILAQRLRRGACNSPRGAGPLIADALACLRRLPGMDTTPVLVRADSAYYGYPAVSAVIRAGADVSVTVKLNQKVLRTIASIAEPAWRRIEYPGAIRDEDTGAWISDAEVAEAPYTAFMKEKKADQVTGRLVVRRVIALNPKARTGQPTLFDPYRYHAFFTTSSLDTITADKTHRDHAVIEQVHADLKNSALAHLPSGKINANAAWLVLAVLAFNLTRAAATLTGPQLAKATTGTIRRKLITIPARISNSARRLRLHLPRAWPFEDAWQQLFTSTNGPPTTATT